MEVVRKLGNEKIIKNYQLSIKIIQNFSNNLILLILPTCHVIYEPPRQKSFKESSLEAQISTQKAVSDVNICDNPTLHNEENAKYFDWM